MLFLNALNSTQLLGSDKKCEALQESFLPGQAGALMRMHQVHKNRMRSKNAKRSPGSQRPPGLETFNRSLPTPHTRFLQCPHI